MQFMITSQKTPKGRRSKAADDVEMHIWMSADAEETDLQWMLDYYKNMGARVVVFRSGTRSLEEPTQRLLAQNCRPRWENSFHQER